MCIRTKQINLFELIKSNYKSKRKFIDDMCKHLPYQKSAIYYRLRGETLLSLDEIFKLAKIYHISLDDVLGLNGHKISFEYPTINYSVTDHYILYLKQLRHEFDQIPFLKNKRVYYQARELPTFYYFDIPELAYFKMYIFNNVCWKDPKKAIEKFSFERIHHDHELRKMMQSVYKDYVDLDRKEYWLSYPYYYTIYQIYHCLSNNLFENGEDALLLLDYLLQLNRKLERIMSPPLGSGSANNVELYYNEMNSHNNIILFESDRYSVVYSSLQNPNHIKSYDLKFIGLTREWLARTEDLSVPLSQGNSIKLSNYFARHTEKLEVAKNQFKLQLMANQLQRKF